MRINTDDHPRFGRRRMRLVTDWPPRDLPARHDRAGPSWADRTVTGRGYSLGPYWSRPSVSWPAARRCGSGLFAGHRSQDRRSVNQLRVEAITCTGDLTGVQVTPSGREIMLVQSS